MGLNFNKRVLRQCIIIINIEIGCCPQGVFQQAGALPMQKVERFGRKQTFLSISGVLILDLFYGKCGFLTNTSHICIYMHTYALTTSTQTQGQISPCISIHTHILMHIYMYHIKAYINIHDYTYIFNTQICISTHTYSYVPHKSIHKYTQSHVYLIHKYASHKDTLINTCPYINIYLQSCTQIHMYVMHEYVHHIQTFTHVHAQYMSMYKYAHIHTHRYYT